MRNTKNILIAILFIALVITLTGCGKKVVDDQTNNEGTTTADATTTEGTTTDASAENEVVTDVSDSLLDETDDVDIGSLI